jgi:hypothetical protein
LKQKKQKKKSKSFDLLFIFGDVSRRRESFSSQSAALLENSHLGRHRLQKQSTELFLPR